MAITGEDRLLVGFGLLPYQPSRNRMKKPTPEIGSLPISFLSDRECSLAADRRRTGCD